MKEVIKEIAEEYSNSEIPDMLLDSLHKKILRSKFAEEVTEQEIDALVRAKMNKSENLTSSEENCKWIETIFFVFTDCGFRFDNSSLCYKEYKFCPYCGKEIMRV